MKLSSLEQKILMNIQLSVICVDIVDYHIQTWSKMSDALENCMISGAVDNLYVCT